ncbi:MAG: DUF1285 domain-containing protein [Pseudomonadota bacterium]
MADGLQKLEAMLRVRDGNSSSVRPVERWEPDLCGEIDIEIRADGSWYYLGTPITRHAMVKLFASVLRKDEDGITYLVTPVEKLAIKVEDAHFLAVDMAVTEDAARQAITFQTSLGDLTTIGPDHSLRFETDTENGGVKPYVCVRGRLEALVSRSLAQELLSLGSHEQVDGKSMFGISSCGVFFPVMESEKLKETVN